MALTNLQTAIKSLGNALAEKGINSPKLTLLAAAKTALLASIAGDVSLTGAKIPLAKAALTHTIYAIDCANNDMSGSGVATNLAGVSEKKLNEPYHTQQAFTNALAALTA